LSFLLSQNDKQLRTQLYKILRLVVYHKNGIIRKIITIAFHALSTIKLLNLTTRRSVV